MDSLNLESLKNNFYETDGLYDEYGYDKFLSPDRNIIKTVLVTGYFSEKIWSIAASIYGCLRSPEYGAKSPRLIGIDLIIKEEQFFNHNLSIPSLASSINHIIIDNETKGLYTVVYGTSDDALYIINELQNLRRSTIVFYPKDYGIKRGIKSFSDLIMYFNYKIYGPNQGRFKQIFNTIELYNNYPDSDLIKRMGL